MSHIKKTTENFLVMLEDIDSSCNPSYLIMQTTKQAFSAVMTDQKLGRTLLHDLQTETKYPWNFFQENHSPAFVGKV